LTSAQAELAARQLEIDAIAAERWDWTVDAAAVRHIAREHGGEVERLRGQEPVSARDYAALPALIDGAPVERIEEAGRPMLRLAAMRAGTLHVAVWEPRLKRRMLALLTLWKRRVREPQRP
jgi:hypothetical protein